MAKKIISITTKTGDAGQAGLANGERTSKADLVFTVIGELDELNAWLGVVVAQMGQHFPQVVKELKIIQHELFAVGAEVARSPKASLKQSSVTALEAHCRTLQHNMEENWHQKFILPGGTSLGSWIDVARTVCRRCERSVVALHVAQPLSPTLLQYMNRLSDYLYLVRCYINSAVHHKEEVVRYETRNEQLRFST
jgi:cob(I)alamin adenosyltransferase